LTGAADLRYWKRALGPANLKPVPDANGAAQVWIGAAEMRFQLQRFREVSLAVAARVPGEAEEGFYFLHAFNSNRWFAWCERNLFSTPFTWAECRVSVTGPLSIQVGSDGKPFLVAAMSDVPRMPPRVSHAHWQGRVHLPRRSTHGPFRFFHALTCGNGDAWDFAPDDHFELNSGDGPLALGSLADSGFTPRQWTRRLDATHGKSRSHRRLTLSSDA
jgi:hypothetical protein